MSVIKFEINDKGFINFDPVFDAIDKACIEQIGLLLDKHGKAVVFSDGIKPWVSTNIAYCEVISVVKSDDNIELHIIDDCVGKETKIYIDDLLTHELTTLYASIFNVVNNL